MTDPNLSPQTRERLPAWRTTLAVLAGMLGPPVVFLIQFQIAYALVPWLCHTQHRWPLHATHFVALGLVLASTVVAWSELHSHGGHIPAETDSGIGPRIRFMAALGIMSGILFGLLIAAQTLAAFMLDPCTR